MKVALLQNASPDGESVDDRRARVDALIRAESRLGACDLLVLPELWGVGAFRFEAFRDAAEPLDGPTATLARSWARLHGLYVHAGSFVERTQDGRLFNTALLIDPSGEVTAVYRKIHLFGAAEAQELAPGNELAMADIGGIRAGLATCYDLRFPELFRSMLDEGATMTIVSSTWPEIRAAHWSLLTSARAVEDQMYVIACNATGTQNGTPMAGRSRIVDPWGVVVAEAGLEEGFLYADLDPDLPAHTRERFPAVTNRRWPQAAS